MDVDEEDDNQGMDVEEMECEPSMDVVSDSKLVEIEQLLAEVEIPKFELPKSRFMSNEAVLDWSDVCEKFNNLNTKRPLKRLFAKLNRDKTMNCIIGRPKPRLDVEPPAKLITRGKIMSPPKRPLSAYVFFVSKRRSLNRKHSNLYGLPVRHLSDQSAKHEWQTMTLFEKQPYLARAKANSHQYYDQIEQYGTYCTNKALGEELSEICYHHHYGDK